MIAGICAFLSANVWTLLIDAALTLLMIYPLGAFVRHGWTRRKDEICKTLNRSAKQRYLAIFHKETCSEAQADRAFERVYLDEYGLKYFVIPLAILFLVAAVGNFFLASALQELVKPGAGAKQFNVAASAIAGAYTFICWDLFSRMQRLTLSRVDVLRTTLRLVVALPVGFAFAALLNDSLAAFVAFGMGAFPVQVINTILQRQMKKRLDLEWDTHGPRDQVFLLSGIDTPIAERIEDADITTITQLAWADPIQLTMRTNLQFAFVIDIVGQALAWVYLEDKLKPLGVVGLHGAVEIRFLLSDLGVIESTNPAGGSLTMESREVTERLGGVEITEEITEFAPAGDKKSDEYARAAAEAALKAAAKLIDIDVAALMYAFIQIGEDPTAEFLETSWESLTTGH